MRYCSEHLFRSRFESLRVSFFKMERVSLSPTSCRVKLSIKHWIRIEVAANERIYTPLVTLWVFLGQVLGATIRAAMPLLD